MKIVQITPVYPPYRGGIGQVAFEYTERLRARGLDVHVSTPAYRSKTAVEDPDYVHRIAPIVEWGNAGFVPRIGRLIKQYDIVHLHYPFFGGAEVIAVEQLFGEKTPLVVTYHMDVVARGMKAAVFGAHRRALMPMIMKGAQKILVSSRDYAEHSDIRLLAEDDRLLELPFGIDQKRFSPGNAPHIKERLNIPMEEPVILFVGGLADTHYFKGVHILLDALEKMEDLPWHMVLVGTGNRLEQYKAMARVSTISKRVHFAGKVSHEELPDFYRMANIHVLPSTDRSEAFGVVTLEAAASGLPSVVSNLPGVRTLVEHERTGFHAEVANADDLSKQLRTLIENPTLAERMGEAARRRVEIQYNWESLTDQLMDVYKSVHRR